MFLTNVPVAGAVHHGGPVWNIQNETTEPHGSGVEYISEPNATVKNLPSGSIPPRSRAMSREAFSIWPQDESRPNSGGIFWLIWQSFGWPNSNGDACNESVGFPEVVQISKDVTGGRGKGVIGKFNLATPTAMNLSAFSQSNVIGGISCCPGWDERAGLGNLNRAISGVSA